MILNDNSTQQINTLVIQLQNRITNLTNESRKLNKEISELDSEISDLERKVSSNENDASGMNTEISDLERRISSLANDTAAMNTEISANTEAISGKADKIHTHTKSEITDFPTSLKNPNALIVNGKTYDGSTAVDAGVQTVANGGTGVTTQADINKAFIGNLEAGESDVTDGTEFVSSYASNNGFAETADGALNKPYKRKFSKVWNYIKGKADSIYFRTTGNEVDPTEFSNWMNTNGSYVDKTKPGWMGSVYTFYAGRSQSGLMFRVLGEAVGPNQVQMNYSIDSNRFGMEWATIINSKNIGDDPVIKSLEQRVAALESKA